MANQDSCKPNLFDLSGKFTEMVVVNEVIDKGDNGDGGVNFDAYEDILVEVCGGEVLPAVSIFTKINLGEALSLNIERCKYVRTTSVQRHAIPLRIRFDVSIDFDMGNMNSGMVIPLSFKNLILI
ncbi:hypothetical protein Scep_001815 [Stephania cephalantha]|uniref:Uncharacterized protein n=1 Tax=Stephania cephalantha TaxID=152367 RepID=A0AAP0LCK4_9MAGN